MQPLSNLLRSMPSLLVGTIRLVPPHTHAIPYEALDHANLVGPLGRIVRNLDQRLVRLLSIRLFHHALVVIRDLLTWLLEQLGMYKRRKRPRRATGGCGLVCWEFETDEDTTGGRGVRGWPAEKRGHSRCPFWPQ